MPQSSGLLSAQKRCEIEYLRALADERWFNKHNHPPKSHGEKFNIPYDAEILVRLVKTSSLAARDPKSSEVSKLIGCYKQHERLDMDDMKDEALDEVLDQAYRLVDKIFFFKLLNRSVEEYKDKNKSRKMRRLVILETEHHNEELLGCWFPISSRHKWDDRIKIALRGSKRGHKHDWATLFNTVCHESVHAFLVIFSDYRHKDYEKMVENGNGHGAMFRKLLRFILETVCHWTGSSKLQKEIDTDQILNRSSRRHHHSNHHH